jgi:hypothetical protein
MAMAAIISAATECGHPAPSLGMKWCYECAGRRKVCRACGEPLAGTTEPSKES